MSCSLAAIEITDQRNAAADLFFAVSTPPPALTSQPLTKNPTHTQGTCCTKRDHPHTPTPFPLHTNHKSQPSVQPTTHTLIHPIYTHSQVNAKIYTDEAAKLGTNLTIEVFEPVLDEEGDVKNMVMYMVAETIGDLPL